MTLTPFELTRFLDEDGEPTALYRAATRRIALGFYEDPGDAKLQRWNAEHEQQMRAVIRGFTDEDTTLAGLPSAQGPHPVATIFGFPNTVEVGAGAVPAWMITGVGVAPTHRRRGILRRMMEPELAQARSEGCGMAALTVSEGEIYGRFGFGLSTRMITYELDLTARPRLLPGVVERSGARQGRIHQAQGKELVEFGLALREPIAGFRAGQAVRPRGVVENAVGAVNLSEDQLKPDGARQALVFEGPDGVEGYAAFNHQGWGSSSPGPNRVVVKDFQAVSTRARVALWEQLLSLDLVDFLEFRAAPGNELARALSNPRAVRQIRETDVLWTRILDVARVLERREYLADGELVLLVDDPLGLVTGAYHLRIRDGRAEVVPGRAVSEVDVARAGEGAEAAVGAGESAGSGTADGAGASTELPGAHLLAARDERRTEAEDEPELAPQAARVRFPVQLLASAVFQGCEPEVRFGLVTGEGAEEVARLFAIRREPYCDFIF